MDWTGLDGRILLRSLVLLEHLAVLINEKRRIEPTDMLKEAFMKVLRTVLMAK